MEDIKNNSISFLKMIISGNIDKAFSLYVHEDFFHHNPYFEGDRDSLKKGMIENYFKNPNKILNIFQCIQEDEKIAVHSNLTLTQNKMEMILIHIFRFQDDKIIEIWDIGSPIPLENLNMN